MILGNKWTPLILRELAGNCRRFGELERALTGISPRTLSQRLDELAEWEIVSREEFDEVPPRVEYALTPKGKDLLPIIQKMADWGGKYPDR